MHVSFHVFVLAIDKVYHPVYYSLRVLIDILARTIIVLISYRV